MWVRVFAAASTCARARRARRAGRQRRGRVAVLGTNESPRCPPRRARCPRSARARSGGDASAARQAGAASRATGRSRSQRRCCAACGISQRARTTTRSARAVELSVTDGVSRAPRAQRKRCAAPGGVKPTTARSRAVRCELARVEARLAARARRGVDDGCGMAAAQPPLSQPPAADAMKSAPRERSPRLGARPRSLRRSRAVATACLTFPASTPRPPRPPETIRDPPGPRATSRSPRASHRITA